MKRTERPIAPLANDWPNWPTRLVCTGLFVLTLVAYWPALQGGFIWDDHPGHVTRRDLQPLGGLFRIWFEPGATQQYYPLLHSAFWLEHHLWGESAFAYHLLNVLLHATAACLVGVVLRRLKVRGAWLAAALFALHPVCVESVAWISEQKNTLSAVLYLCALLAYVRFDQERRGRTYAFATALFTLALATKTVTATLPAALLVIFWWQRGRPNVRRDVVPLLPWFALGAAGGLVTAWVERTMIGAQGATFTLDAAQRLVLAGRVVWFYLGKLLWPAELVFVYPRWQIDATAAWQWGFTLGAIGVVVGLALSRRATRGALAGALFFVGTLFPALGFVNVYPFQFSFVADHFQYLASLGVLTLIAAGLMIAADRWTRFPRWLLPATLLVVCGALTWRQSADYRDVITLYETTLRRNPDAWLAHNNLAEALTAAGRPQDAIPHLEAALKLRADFPEAENNLGDDLRRLGQAQEAIPHLQRAIALRPQFPEAHNNLGIALATTKHPTEALTEFETAFRLRPQFPEAQFNLGLTLATAGRTAEALTHFEQAVRLDPNYAEAELNWAIGLTLTNRFNEAVRHFERAIALNPGSAETLNLYGRALATSGRYEDAIARCRQALEVDPNLADAHLNLALALRQLGRVDEAQQHYEAARRLGR
jgi:tetratricopeptide (TPR) repeat protein